MTMATEIPNTLYQIGRRQPEPDDGQNYHCLQSWLKHHPNWNRRFFDDDDIEQYLLEHRSEIDELFPHFLQTYRDYPHHIERMDAFRYLVIYFEGGLYADTDVMFHQAIDPLLIDRTCVFSVEILLSDFNRRKRRFLRPACVGNCIFAATPRHPAMRVVLERLSNDKEARHYDGIPDQVEHILQQTGPSFLTRALQTLPITDIKEGVVYLESEGESVSILPQIYLMPPHYYLRIPMFGKSIYAHHCGTGEWTVGLSRHKTLMEFARLRLDIRLANRPPWPFWPKRPGTPAGDDDQAS